ncbi:YybH family protein [Kordiimonas aquimaris]|uniref:YybH family protein n=1 Tax=Kordiimonas aquimaris TaxID=707591 RepID=UPI0021CFF43B|nr:nuclear transport factor 2 family protein [Kordiimonas aquimaris]
MYSLKLILSKTVIGVLVLLVSYTASADGASDTAKVHAVYQSYADIWMRNDDTVPAGIMGLFTDDAVIMPHHGDPVRIGKAAIGDFWFPGGVATGTVDHYAHQVMGEQIIGDMAYIYGRFTLKFTYADRVTENEGNQLAVMRRTPEGWKIAALIWNDPLPQTTAAE